MVVGVVAIGVVVVVVVGGEIVIVKVVDEDYLMNNFVRFSTYHRIDFDHQS